MQTAATQVRSGALAKLVGKAPAFVEAIVQIPAIAKSGAPVLITGETGTGKELVARAVHYSSERASHPFVAVNCGSMVESLLEDELFGHARGAFTGAVRKTIGVLAEAHGGTLFLDEVDTLSGKAQVDLLRVLQERKFRPIGSRQDQEADVRILAATNAGLERLIDKGSFRIDLYYRLCVFSIHLPPLRDRREDILDLTRHFLKKHAPSGTEAPVLSDEASGALEWWRWPGNVRELENAIIRGIHLSSGGVIRPADLCLPRVEGGSAAEDTPAASFRSGKRDAIAAFEKDYLGRLLAAHGGNITHAAAAARKERRDFGKLLKKHNLNAKTFRTGESGC